MRVCPLCEHAQEAGEVCELCGKELVASAPVEIAVTDLPGLEQTRWEEPFPEDSQLMPELEPTLQTSAGEVTTESFGDLEQTAQAAVTVEAVVLEDLDRARSADTDPRTPVITGAVTCRYCKNVQEAGLLCDRCGMRLSRTAIAPVRAVALGELARCQQCGEKVRLGTRCGGCGQLASVAES